MKRKLLSALLVTSMMLTMVPPAFATDATPVPPTNENAPSDSEGAPNIEVSDAAALVEAVKADNAQITLTDNITLDSALTIDKPVTIDGQNHTITGAVNLQNGTVRNTTFTNAEKKEILMIGSTSQDVKINLIGCTVRYPSGAITASGQRGTISHTINGNAATVTIDGCKFVNSGRSKTEWSYGLYFNTQNGGTINLQNSTFDGTFRTMLASINGNVNIIGNTFTNYLGDILEGPEDGAYNTCTAMTTGTETNHHFVIRDNTFNDAGSFFFQKIPAEITGNTFNLTLEGNYPYFQIKGATAEGNLDLNGNTFNLGNQCYFAYDLPEKQVIWPAGVPAIHGWMYAEVGANANDDFANYIYTYLEDGHIQFKLGSETALSAILTGANGNWGVSSGDTVTFTDSITMSEALEITGDTSVTFDLNGKRLTSTADVLLKNNGTGTLTITGNGTMDNSAATSADAVCVWARTGDMVIENGTFINKSNTAATVYAGESTSDTTPVVTIKGGTFKNLAEGDYTYNPALKPLTLNVQDDKPVNSIVVSGGRFSGNDPSKGDDNLQGSFVADDAIVRKDGADFTVVAKSGLTEGIYTSDPSGFTAENYVVTDNKDGTWTVYYKAPSTSGGSSSGNKTETTVNPDGSTTTTVTRPNGSTTETTKYPDGSKEVVDTKKDGTVTTTVTDKDGNKTETVEKTDGSSTTDITKTDGSSSTTTVSKDGDVDITVTLPGNVIEDAKGNAIPLPMPEASVTEDANKAPTITIDMPKDTTAKVEVPVKDVTAGTVAILVKEDGTEEIIKTTIQSENGVIVTLADGDTIKIVDNSKDFVDVPDNFWAAETIDFVTARGLFGGTGDTTFSPNMAMTRAMIVTVLARLDGADTSGGKVWYEKGREWAMENGISDGNGMMDNLTREQLVTMLWRYADTPSSSHTLSNYKDAATISPFAADAFAWAVEEGMIAGTDAQTLSPQGIATRAQVAAILTRFCTNIAK